MGKYSRFTWDDPKNVHTDRVHPIWRGIGCILLCLIPILAYAASTVIVQADLANGWYPIPYELSQTIFIPVIEIRVEYLYATLLLSFVLMIIGYGLVMAFYALIYRMIGPPKYGPLDSPPIRRT